MSPAAAATVRSPRRGGLGQHRRRRLRPLPARARRCGAAGDRVRRGRPQDLPFENASFDVATSIFGAMFAPDQEKAAAELLRVVRPGGRIGMGNWCPDGAVGKMFKTIAKHAPPPAGLDSPLLWGTEERLRKLFGDGITDLRAERRISRQPFHSADHYIEFFRTYFGPTQTAYERVGPEGEQALTDNLRALLEAENTAGERAMVLEAEYLEVIAIRAG